MNTQKRQNVYKIIMLIVLTITITYIVTAITFYQKIQKSDVGEIDDYILSYSDDSTDMNLTEIKAILSQKYIGDLDEEKMYEGAIKGYVSGLGDPYTEYLSKEDMDKLKEDTSGKYVGIGVYVTNDTTTDSILVVGVMKNSPALEAGIQAGDYIIKVDNVEYAGSELSDAVSVLKGEENTNVKVTVLREENEIELDITRKEIKIESVSSEIISEDIGVITISSFDDDVAKKFEEEYSNMKDNIKGLIIDLRSNGGGVVEEATDIADLFTEKDQAVLITVDKNDKEKVTKAEREKVINDIPVVVLINQATASASEILAAALKENYSATIVGKTSYGKGVIQTVYELTNGAGLKVTTNEYFTPNHNVIDKKGIEPDEDIELDKDEEGYYITDQDKDTQLLKAIDILKNKQ